MSIMKLLQQAQGGRGLSQLAQQFGLDDGKAQDLAHMLAPAIGQAAKKRAEGGQADTVLAFMRGEDKASFFDDSAAAATPEGMAQGRSFLESLMGDAGATDGLASAAAERTGVDPDTVAQFLPALAAMAQGGLQKQMPDAAIDAMSSGGGLMGMVSGLMGGGGSGKGNGLQMLNDLLDADGDGSAVDDILGRFMK